MEKIVIVHDEFGIYVGEAFGLGFWSKIDSVDQPAVPAWDAIEDAKEYISNWRIENNPANYRYEAVEVGDDTAIMANVEELFAAGLGEDMGFLNAQLQDRVSTHPAPKMIN
jgi:hypothetical protein